MHGPKMVDIPATDIGSCLSHDAPFQEAIQGRKILHEFEDQLQYCKSPAVALRKQFAILNGLGQGFVKLLLPFAKPAR